MAHPEYPPTSSFGASSHVQGQKAMPFQTNKVSLKVLLLHGNLDIWVREAKNLPNLDTLHSRFREKFAELKAKVRSKIEGHLCDNNRSSDPYVTVSVSEVHFFVKDSYVVGSETMGAVKIPVKQLCSGMKVEGTFPIFDDSGKPCKAGAVLSLSIQYTPVDKMNNYHGVDSGPDCQGVPGTYFPLRKGGKVTLYQDAHVHDGCLPNLKLDGDVQYEHRSCWNDIFEAITRARHLIYIAGWSVYHTVRLIRDVNKATDCMLGDLLKTKSKEGVRVLLLVWDDPTSKSFLGHKREGIMHTNDEETRHFFKHSSVQVLLCPRSAGKGRSLVKKKEAGIIYSHHQKTVIVDTDAGHCKRKILAFVGGLDLCKGRYDTPIHPLFRTLQTVHKDDYRNTNFMEPTVGCPRQPWHDLHCCIDGPAAYDILTNFEERWLKESKPHGLRKLIGSSYDDALLMLESISDIIGKAEFPSQSQNDPEGWHVQVFRSIDSNSVEGFPEDPKYATSRNLLCGKNVLIDMSIHTAYVKAIRAAQKFIYIENQYFLGSSYNWDSHKNLGANNLIPIEIALKIVNTIKANQRFSAYIIIPMWPEAASIVKQQILYWQHKTMQMMYEMIYNALKEVGLETEYEPQDYLNFFCLGNREASDREESLDAEDSTAVMTPQALAQRSRRFMVYVHSKGMIVDDEYVILGSANINQRSLEGIRDTEIAMGAYQPYHTWASKDSSPHGQIYGYRMSLWAEHIGALEECFKQPESLECVRQVRSLSELNWRQYAADEVTEMKGHLLKYPVEVDRTGKVKPLPDCVTFPDIGGTVTGSRTFAHIHENLTI
ncbi:hypothetical protein ACB092_10G071300 [Castanea dentata]